MAIIQNGLKNQFPIQYVVFTNLLYRLTHTHAHTHTLHSLRGMTCKIITFSAESQPRLISVVHALDPEVRDLENPSTVDDTVA